MRIAICSTACNGKTTLINEFLRKWPMYKTPEKTYRDLIKEKNLQLNSSGNIETQTIIRDSLVDQAIENVDIKKRIDDRCILDNIAYTIWLAENKKINDADFVANSINICRETIKLYDIIFWLPLNLNIKLNNENNENRSVNAEIS